MNPAQLLAYFDRISEAPDAVPCLRRFIIDLAVRGKLVEQDRGDEPATELLKQIQAEKARQTKTGKIIKHDSLPPIKEGEIPFTLPDSWAWIRVGEAFLYDAGIKRDPKELEPDLWLLELEDIEKDTGLVLNYLKVKDRDSRSTKSEFEVGDILYGKLRPYLNKVVVAKERGYSTTEVVAIRPFGSLCPEFCSLAFRRPEFVAYVTRLGQGTKMPRLRTPDALVALFPLPPLSEQKRIVARVDELMALCGGLEASLAERESRRDLLVAASLQRLSQPPSEDATAAREDARFYLGHLPRLIARPEQIKQLRHAILDLGVRGRLVPQDPADKPTEVNLALSDRVRGKTANEDRRAEAFQLDLLLAEDRWTVPTSWQWRALADLALFIDYRGHTPSKVEQGVRLVTAKNVKRGFIDLSPEEFLSEVIYDTWMTRGYPAVGDVLFTTEAPMGNAAVVRLAERFALAQRVICFRLYGSIDPDFLVFQLLAEPFQEILNKAATGLTAKGIKAAKLKRLPVAIPPLAEQRRIVAKVNELMALCDRLEVQLIATQIGSRRLLEAVLYEALAD